ncbi:MAG: alpha-L-fucosidase, partial [Parabacteroides sp.]
MHCKQYIAAWGLLVSLLPACQETPAPEAYGPCPSEDQITWQEMERTAFIHFSMNTFTDIEWGYGDVPTETFNPSALDCDQWVTVCKQAGIKGIILTTKHHDGFCLWPTATTEYSVKNSPWKDGKGDLVRELSDACRKQGLKFGVYLSPWDRNTACYGTPEYIQMFRAQLTELLTNYGEIFEVWFDGANGGTGYYGGAREDRSVDRKNYYDWPGTIALVRQLQPHAMIFGDGGPDVRWCGDEEGWVGETNWSPLRRDEVYPGWPLYEQLRYGHEDGTHWVPAEVDVSTRPGWFYHASEDHKVKTLPRLLDIYYQSCGRNGQLLINFPVDKRGRIHANDSTQMVRLAEAIEADFAVNLAADAKAEATQVRGNSRKYRAANVTDNDKESYWATDDSITNASLTLQLKKPTEVNRFLVQEYIRLGQRVKGFTVEAFVNGDWQLLDKQTTIGYKRILRFPTVTTDKIRFTITDAKACPLISHIALYHAPKVLTAPTVQRDKKGLVTVKAADAEASLHYTLDGSVPTAESPLYEQPVLVDHPATFQVIAYDPERGQSSPVTKEEFDVVRTDWKVVGTEDANTEAL